MSDTPLTDAATSQRTEYSGYGRDRIAVKVSYVEVKDCRDIERELREEIAALRAENERLERERYELAHAIWHALDDSCEDMSSGEITIMRSDYDRLCSLVPDDHEELHKRFDPSVAAAEKEPT